MNEETKSKNVYVERSEDCETTNTESGYHYHNENEERKTKQERPKFNICDFATYLHVLESNVRAYPVYAFLSANKYKQTACAMITDIENIYSSLTVIMNQIFYSFILNNTPINTDCAIQYLVASWIYPSVTTQVILEHKDKIESVRPRDDDDAPAIEHVLCEIPNRCDAKMGELFKNDSIASSVTSFCVNSNFHNIRTNMYDTNLSEYECRRYSRANNYLSKVTIDSALKAGTKYEKLLDRINNLNHEWTRRFEAPAGSIEDKWKNINDIERDFWIFDMIREIAAMFATNEVLATNLALNLLATLDRCIYKKCAVMLSITDIEESK